MRRQYFRFVCGRLRLATGYNYPHILKYLIILKKNIYYTQKKMGKMIYQTQDIKQNSNFVAH